ncbi:Zinc finger CCCH domain-containing protein 49 [Capsicum chinense]|nr:Zinc finger CCCH domain-containing protein 49 [Capsicum chinense]
MMIGERNRRHPTVDIPPWDDRTVNNKIQHFMEEEYSLFVHHDSDYDYYEEVDAFQDVEIPVDVFACDNFRMYEFKVRRCTRGRSHDWTECPYVHPGEKARRRDPRKYHYSGTACPDFRKGNCTRGDGCEFAHGVFECWLHPCRYRTQPCKDGGSCKRRVCFFAHSPEQLRVLSPGQGIESRSDPRSEESSSPPTESPPLSPMTVSSVNSLSRSLGSNSVNEVMASLRQLQLNRLNSMPSSFNVQMNSPVFGSPRRVMTRPGYFSLPATPSGDLTRPGYRVFDTWEKGEYEEEPVMERVESGRDLRVKMFEKLSKENPLDPVDPNPNSNPGPNPDVRWVSDLIQ